MDVKTFYYECDYCVNSFVDELKDFEKQLTDNQEMVVSVNGYSFRLEKLRHDHNTIIYYGSLADNTPVVLVQHYHQLNVLFFAVPKRNEEEAAVRIGLVQV